MEMKPINTDSQPNSMETIRNSPSSDPHATAELCVVHWLGQMAYAQAWELQNQFAQEIANNLRPASLLLVEHPPTYTFGRSGKPSNLIWDEAELSRHQIQTHWVDRGGDVTYHGPGQLVGYPLLPLNPGGLKAGSNTNRLPRADYLGYLRKLEAMLIRALAMLGISAHTIKGLTGVWVDLPGEHQSGSSIPAKIAAIGIKVDAKGISRHGFALNVNPNMEHWQGIIPCGIQGCQVTSVAEMITPCPSMGVVRSQISAAFKVVFGYEIRFADESDTAV